MAITAAGAASPQLAKNEKLFAGKLAGGFFVGRAPQVTHSLIVSGMRIREHTKARSFFSIFGTIAVAFTYPLVFILTWLRMMHFFPLRLLAVLAGYAYFALATSTTAEMQYNWSNFVGLPGGSPGSLDARGAAAQFNSPYGVAFDSAGNLYVADKANQTIRKITSDGAVTTVAGKSGAVGSSDGTGAEARFSNPSALAVDSMGNIYVADTFNNTIRKVTSDGVVTTLAGQAHLSGSADGTGAAARFDHPSGITVDSSGNLYVADLLNYTIRKITPEGMVTTLAGIAGVSGSVDGTGASARFTQPRGIACDSMGNLFVTDPGDFTIRKITLAGEVTTVAGLANNSGTADGTRNAARFTEPAGIAVNGTGLLYVGDGSALRTITPEGMVTTLCGQINITGGDDGLGSAASFAAVLGVAVNSSGAVYIADADNNAIRKVTSAGAVTTFAGLTSHRGNEDGTGPAARFNHPISVALDGNGTAYVADYYNSIIRKVTSQGVVTTLAGTFSLPAGVTTDPSGNVYVADALDNSIRKITHSGDVTTLANIPRDQDTGDSTYTYIQGLAADADGTVYVANYRDHAILKISATGQVTTLAGSGQPGGDDGLGSAATFASPLDMAVDPNGNVYVADAAGDESGNTIRKITPAGVVTTIAGKSGTQGSADGVGGAARFNYPSGVAIGSDGNLYVADTGNHTIRRVTPDGTVTTIGGVALAEGIADGPGATARFSSPGDLALNAAGVIFVADTGNNRISRGVPESFAETRLANVSTRLRTGTGDNVLIGGFIVRGTGTKKVVVRALGPSLTALGVPGALNDPTITVYDSHQQVVATNDDWTTNSTSDQTFLQSAQLDPSNSKESALVVSLAEGAYTAIARGVVDTTGNCLLEIYDVDPSASAKVANLSSRGPVGTGDNVMISGIIVRGSQLKRVLARALGPSLAAAGVPNALADPILEIHSSYGTIVGTNDDWRSTQQEEIVATGLAPSDPAESAILLTLPPGSYTAIIRGVGNTTGNALSESYDLP